MIMGYFILVTQTSNAHFSSPKLVLTDQLVVDGEDYITLTMPLLLYQAKSVYTVRALHKSLENAIGNINSILSLTINGSSYLV